MYETRLTSRTSFSLSSPLQHQIERSCWALEIPSDFEIPMTVMRASVEGEVRQTGEVAKVVAGGTVWEPVGFAVVT
jgi:hypothetical protein